MAQVLAPVGGGSNVGEVVKLNDGGFMVVWTHLVTSLFPIPNVADTAGTAVLGRVFNADGTPRGAVFQVNQSNANSGQGNADLAVLNNGNVVVVWTDGPNLDDFDVAAVGRILTPTGAPVTDEFELALASDRDQRIPQVAANDKGGFFATWSDGRSPWSNTNEQWIGQEFDANGNRLGAELWIRNDRSSEDSELVHLNDGFYTLAAAGSLTFDSDARYTYFGDIESSTNFVGFANPPSYKFNDDTVTNGNGQVASVGPRDGVTVLVSFLVPQTRNNSSNGTWSDGTPFAETITFLNTDPDLVVRSTITLTGMSVAELGFTPSGFHVPAVAASYLPNGNLAVVWTGVSGGTIVVPEFSVFAQILSPEGIILSDVQVIADTNVVGSSLAPPFVSAGANGQLFIGWTGTTSRNGEGTNEVMGGVFDIPTYPQGSVTPSGTLATDGSDNVTGVAAVDFQPTPPFYLLDGDDIWTQGAATQTEGVFGMAGDDRFIVTDPATLGALNLQPGPGRDILDLSGATTAHTNFSATASYNGVNGSGSGFEVVIGTTLDDDFRAPSNGTIFNAPLPTPENNAYLHTEAGNDTISFDTTSSGVIDGGAGFDVMTTFERRATYDLTFHGDHYTLSHLADGVVDPVGTIEPRNVMTLRSIEEIRFVDETVTLQPTSSLPSGGVGSEGGLIVPVVDPDLRLLGSAGVSDTLTGRGGDDLLYGDGYRAAYDMAQATTVYRLYQATLDRTPDTAGQNAWTGRLVQETQTLQQVAAGFVGSLEFERVYGSLGNAAFVELLYQNVLGRAADAGGLAGWTGLLAGGTSRAQVVTGFSESAEFRTATNAEAVKFTSERDPASWSDDIFRLYTATLDRAPDAAGFSGWSANLSDGAEFLNVVAGFVNSREFQNTYGTLDNGGFVSLLYRNVLDRAPDTAGLASWTQQLEDGTTRAQVVQGFSQSREFIAATNPDLKDWMREQGVQDTLAPGGGSNQLWGGEMADVFVFSAADVGTSHINDFEAWDFLRLEGFGYANAGAAIANLSQSGANVVFEDQGTTITIADAQLAMFAEDTVLV